MRYIVGIAVMGFVLTGCNTASRAPLTPQQRAVTYAQNSSANCRGGKHGLAGGYAEYSRCVAKWQAAYAASIGIPAAKYEALMTKREEIYSRVDRGYLTPAEAKAEMLKHCVAASLPALCGA